MGSILISLLICCHALNGFAVWYLTH